MGRKKSSKNQAFDDATARQQRQQAFNIMLGFDQALEGFSEQEKQDILLFGEELSQEAKEHQARLLVEALKEQQELVTMESEYQVARGQFLQNFPQFEAKLRAIEDTGRRRRDAGLMQGLTQGDISKWV
ncbi:MAG: hypothetical protein KME11_04815 [Timaviella obliquedivisa GSE-PSE-MK23-08B]|jgi:hypothetical protein|nr:hypothetical protein [Timaviella obliquedivisa GSE-PSE-MK23-08B]